MYNWCIHGQLRYRQVAVLIAAKIHALQTSIPDSTDSLLKVAFAISAVGSTTPATKQAAIPSAPPQVPVCRCRPQWHS